ncbi:TPA: hypothetical protein QCV70_002488 [Bacillus cereus]|nr:hypothetical protein [Bacillus cereus]
MIIDTNKISQEIANGALERLDRLIEQRERERVHFPYIQQSQLKRELGISKTYLAKLIVHGLKEVKLEENDRTTWYKRSQLVQLMDDLAE